MIRENIITAFREDILEGNVQRGHMELGNKKKREITIILWYYTFGPPLFDKNWRRKYVRKSQIGVEIIRL